ESFDDIDGLMISVDITNSGQVAGQEIVQVYVHDQQASLSRPVKELKGFAKVALEPGQTKTVKIPLDFRAFAFYHPKYKSWITEDGDFDILIAASSQDIRCQLTTHMTSSLHLPCLLDKESTIKEWLSDPRGAEVVQPVFEELKGRFENLFGGDEGIGMDPLGMIIDMPLYSVLMFIQNLLPEPVDDIVDRLLQEVHSDEK
ncbi:MAG: fibronectin type III-like domain-contianing protein, partial [Anaerolineales bacterium]